MFYQKIFIGLLGLGLLFSAAACAKNNISSTSVLQDQTKKTLSAVVNATMKSQTTDNLPKNTPSPTVGGEIKPISTKTVSPSSTMTRVFTPSLDTRLSPQQWGSWPIVPKLSEIALKIYKNGQQLGNNPQVISVVGDCQSEPDVFLGIYDTNRYWLGNYTYLQDTIDYYQGAFSHKSISVRDGLSAPSALSPQWADPNQCQPDENPVACELRVYKPSIVFINLGTNWKAGASADRYEKYLRQIVDLVIGAGALPILSTKADNVEGDHSLNLATARVAYDYDIPLWNFWLAAQSLPNGGLDPKRNNIYLSYPDGWDRRNFTALQTLDSIRRTLQNLPSQPAP